MFPRGISRWWRHPSEPIFAQPNRQAAKQQLAEVVRAMQPRWSKASEPLAAAETEILAYMDFPQDRWVRIYSTNLLEHVIREVRRRINVVGVLPDEPSLIRLVGALLVEMSDEWEIERRYFSLETMRRD